MRAILTYHMTRLDAHSREGADLLGLRADLAMLLDQGIPLRTLDELVDSTCDDGVAITWDDGTRIDAEPIVHPRLGALPSALSVLQEFAPRLPPKWHASTFVIASPQARAELAAALEADYGVDLMHERWWQPAAASGLVRIENHSWDHNHPALACSVQRDNRRGSFLAIETAAEAEAEITAASAYIADATGRQPRYFAYPFGEASAYLRHSWLPQHGPAIGLSAAFSTEPRPLSDRDDRWWLPRFVCGRDWTDDDGLARLLAASEQ
jgi:peptidoglycan/xylan/chitin deacetylase (PgdA/CDA1 family)